MCFINDLHQITISMYVALSHSVYSRMVVSALEDISCYQKVSQILRYDTRHASHVYTT